MFKKYMCLALCVFMVLGAMTTTASAAEAVDTLSASSVTFTDAAGTPLTALPGTAGTVKSAVTVTNSGEAAQPIVFWVGKYVADVLVDVAYQYIPTFTGSQELTLQLDNVSASDTVLRANVWMGFVGGKAVAYEATFPSDDRSIAYVLRDGTIWNEFDPASTEATILLERDVYTIPTFTFVPNDNSTKVTPPRRFAVGENTVQVTSADGQTDLYTLNIAYRAPSADELNIWINPASDGVYEYVDTGLKNLDPIYTDRNTFTAIHIGDGLLGANFFKLPRGRGNGTLQTFMRTGETYFTFDAVDACTVYILHNKAVPSLATWNLINNEVPAELNSSDLIRRTDLNYTPETHPYYASRVQWGADGNVGVQFDENGDIAMTEYSPGQPEEPNLRYPGYFTYTYSKSFAKGATVEIPSPQFTSNVSTTTEDNFFVVVKWENPKEPDPTDATLGSLQYTINGQGYSVPGFTPGASGATYDIIVPADTTKIDGVTAMVNETGASYVISPEGEVALVDGAATITVTVTSPDKSNTEVYTLNFELAKGYDERPNKVYNFVVNSADAPAYPNNNSYTTEAEKAIAIGSYYAIEDGLAEGSLMYGERTDNYSKYTGIPSSMLGMTTIRTNRAETQSGLFRKVTFDDLTDEAKERLDISSQEDVQKLIDSKHKFTKDDIDPELTIDTDNNIITASSYTKPIFSGPFDGQGANPFWMQFNVSSGATVYYIANGGFMWPNKPDGWEPVKWKEDPTQVVDDGSENAYFKHFNAGELVQIPNIGVPEGINKEEDKTIFFSAPTYIIVWDDLSISETKDATLSTLTYDIGDGPVAIPGFDPNVTEYFVELPEGTPTVSIDGTTNDTDAKITAKTSPVTEFPATMSITVLASDLATTKTYTVSFDNGSLPDTTLSSLTYSVDRGAELDVPDFISGMGGRTFNLEVPFKTQTVTLYAQTTDPTVYMEPENGEITVDVKSGSGTAKFTVETEEGLKQNVYTINITVKQPQITITPNPIRSETFGISNSGDFEIKLADSLMGDLFKNNLATQKVIEEDGLKTVKAKPINNSDGKSPDFEKVDLWTGDNFYSDRPAHKISFAGAELWDMNHIRVPSQDALGRRTFDDSALAEQYKTYMKGTDAYFTMTSDTAGTVVVANPFAMSTNYSEANGWKQIDLSLTEASYPRGYKHWAAIRNDLGVDTASGVRINNVDLMTPYHLIKLRYDNDSVGVTDYKYMYYKEFAAGEQVVIPVQGAEASDGNQDMMKVMIKWGTLNLEPPADPEAADVSLDTLTYQYGSTQPIKVDGFVPGSEEQTEFKVMVPKGTTNVTIAATPTVPAGAEGEGTVFEMTPAMGGVDASAADEAARTVTIKVTSKDRTTSVEYKVIVEQDTREFEPNTIYDMVIQGQPVEPSDDSNVCRLVPIHLDEVATLDPPTTNRYIGYPIENDDGSVDDAGASYLAGKSPAFFEGAIAIQRQKSDAGSTTSEMPYYNDDAYNGVNGYWMSFKVSSPATVYFIDVEGKGWPNADKSFWTLDPNNKDGSANLYYHQFDAGEIVNIPNYGFDSSWGTGRFFTSPSGYVVVWGDISAMDAYLTDFTYQIGDDGARNKVNDVITSATPSETVKTTVQVPEGTGVINLAGTAVEGATLTMDPASGTIDMTDGTDKVVKVTVTSENGEITANYEITFKLDSGEPKQEIRNATIIKTDGKGMATGPVAVAEENIKTIHLTDEATLESTAGYIGYPRPNTNPDVEGDVDHAASAFLTENSPAYFEGALVIQREKQDACNGDVATYSYFNDEYDGTNDNYWLTFEVGAEATVYVIGKERATSGDIKIDHWPHMPEGWTKDTQTCLGSPMYYKTFQAGETVKIPSFGYDESWPTTGRFIDSPSLYVVVWGPKQSSEAGLNAISYTVGGETKEFSLAGTSKTEYTISVPADAGEVVVTPEAVEGATVSDLTPEGGKVTVADTAQTVTFTVTAADGVTTKDYTITVQPMTEQNKVYGLWTMSNHQVYDQNGGYSDELVVDATKAVYAIQDNVTNGASYVTDRAANDRQLSLAGSFFTESPENITMIRRPHPETAPDGWNNDTQTAQVYSYEKPYFAGDYSGEDGAPYWMTFTISSDATVYVGLNALSSKGEWPYAPEGWTKSANIDKLAINGSIVYYKHYKAGDVVQIPNFGPIDDKAIWNPPIYLIKWGSAQDNALDDTKFTGLSYKIDGGEAVAIEEFAPDTYSYVVPVDEGTQNITLEPTGFTNSATTYSFDKTSAAYGESIVMTVTAEDGTEATYTVTFGEAEGDTKLTALTYTIGEQTFEFDSFDASVEGGSYSATIPSTAAEVTINATASDPEAEITYNDSANKVIEITGDETVVAVKVTSGSKVSTYTLTFEREVIDTGEEPGIDEGSELK